MEVEGHKNLPLNPKIFIGAHVLFVDPDPRTDSDIEIALQNIKFEEMYLDPEISDIRIYFDWNTLDSNVIKKIHIILRDIQDKLQRSVKMYFPFSIVNNDTIALDGIMFSQLQTEVNNLHGMFLVKVYDFYPLFDWDGANIYTFDEMSECVAHESYLLITDHDI